MNNNDKIKLFEETPILKAIMILAVPTILSSLVMVIYNLADTYFVGMINNPVQNAAVALAGPILLGFNAVNNLFGVGSSSLMSRALGKRDYKLVSKTSAIAFYCSIFFAAMISIASILFKDQLLMILGADANTFVATAEYIKWTVTFGAVPAILNVVMAYMVRSEGASLHASIGTMSGCILNIFLDPIFILVFDMGAAGAGLATCISNVVACCYFFILLQRKKGNTFISINYKTFSLDKLVILAIFAVGIPASIQNLLNVTGMTILNNIAASYGTDAVAAMGITQKINQVPMQIALGLSQGIMPLISYNYASGNIQRMKDTLYTTIKISMTFLVIVVGVYYLQASNIISLFMSNSIIIEHGTKFLRGYSFGLPFLVFDFIAVGVFQATGKGKEALLFAIMRKIVLEIPALLILNKLYPLYGLAYAQLFAESILATAAVFVLINLFKKINREQKMKL